MSIFDPLQIRKCPFSALTLFVFICSKNYYQTPFTGPRTLVVVAKDLPLMWHTTYTCEFIGQPVASTPNLTVGRAITLESKSPFSLLLRLGKLYWSVLNPTDSISTGLLRMSSEYVWSVIVFHFCNLNLDLFITLIALLRFFWFFYLLNLFFNFWICHCLLKYFYDLYVLVRCYPTSFISCSSCDFLGSWLDERFSVWTWTFMVLEDPGVYF